MNLFPIPCAKDQHKWAPLRSINVMSEECLVCHYIRSRLDGRIEPPALTNAHEPVIIDEFGPTLPGEPGGSAGVV